LRAPRAVPYPPRVPSDRIQLQLPVPYHLEPRDDARVRSYLERGYTIVQYQRLTDQEVVV